MCDVWELRGMFPANHRKEQRAREQDWVLKVSDHLGQRCDNTRSQTVQELQAEHREEIQRLREVHLQGMEDLMESQRKAFEASRSALQQSQRAALDAKDRECQGRIQELGAAHRREIQEMAERHKTKQAAERAAQEAEIRAAVQQANEARELLEAQVASSSLPSYLTRAACLFASSLPILPIRLLFLSQRAIIPPPDPHKLSSRVPCSLALSPGPNSQLYSASAAKRFLPFSSSVFPACSTPIP